MVSLVWSDSTENFDRGEPAAVVQQRALSPVQQARHSIKRCGTVASVRKKEGGRMSDSKAVKRPGLALLLREPQSRYSVING